MIIKIRAENLETAEDHYFFYETVTGKISDHEFEGARLPPYSWEPKQRKMSRVRIQLGLKCNFSCGYCQQAELTKDAAQFPLRDIEAFVDRLLLNVELRPDSSIDYWGGEPFVYWAYIEKITRLMKARIPTLRFFVITNGSLLTKERVDFLRDHDFDLAVSHDGPGQSVRGEDPLETNKEVFDYAIQQLGTTRFSFSPILHKDNASRLKIIEYFESKFPGTRLRLNEMGFVGAVDDASRRYIDFDPAQHFELRRSLWCELRFHNKVRDWVPSKSDNCNLLLMINSQDTADFPPVKCMAGMPDTIGIDLFGNILTCHNTKAGDVAPNGKAHNYGTLETLETSVINTSKHWSERERCAGCPVLVICRGSCIFLDGQEFKDTCEMDYSDHIAQFAVAFEQVTGCVPVEFLTDELPKHRRDVWGSVYDWSPQKAKKVIPIIAIK